MRAPLIIEAQPSPLAKAFSEFSQQLASGPTREEREYRAALAQKTALEAEAAQRQQSAIQGAGDRLSSIFGQYTADGSAVKPWTNPDTGEVVQNTNPSVPLETPEMRAQRQSMDLAKLFTDVGEENAKALRMGLQTGAAYGTPDDMRRSMVLGGKNVGPDFSPTIAEADRIAARNSALDTAKGIAVAKADPKAATPRNYVTPTRGQGFTLDGLTDAVSGAPIPQGSQIFTGQVRADNANSMFPAGVVSNAVSGSDAANAALSTLDELVAVAKPENFGLVGQTRGLLQGVGGQVNALASWGASRRDAIAQQIEADPAAFAGLNFSEFFDESLPQQDLLSNTLAYEYAKTLDADGRLSNEDVKNARAMLGLTGMFASAEAFKAREPLIRRRITAMRDRNAARLPGAAPQGGAPAAPTAPPVAQAQGNPAALLEQARDAIRRGADPGKVMQRLEGMGVTVPSDF